MTFFEVGDTVQASSKSGEDRAVFIVTEVHRDYDNSFALVGRGFKLQDSDFEFKLLKRPMSLPTVPGIYGYTTGGGMKLILTKRGEWYWLDFTAEGLDSVIRGGAPVEESVVREQFEKDTIVLNYEYAIR